MSRGEGSRSGSGGVGGVTSVCCSSTGVVCSGAGGSSPAGSGAVDASGSGSFGCARCAASGASQSSASGPSRMLARLRAMRDLLLHELATELAVRLGGGTGRVVLQHGAALYGRFRISHRLPDAGLEHQLAEVLLEDLDRLARMQ